MNNARTVDRKAGRVYRVSNRYEDRLNQLLPFTDYDNAGDAIVEASRVCEDGYHLGSIVVTSHPNVSDDGGPMVVAEFEEGTNRRVDF